MHRFRCVFAATLLATVVTAGAALAGDVPAPTVPPDGELAFVVDVVDGDTIRVDRDGGGSESVRYIGVDTPEVGHQPGETDEPWGPEATEANAELVRDRLVLLERDVSETDRYDRLLRYVWVETPDGWLMVNGELVADGFADSRAYEPDTRHHAWLEQLEDGARAAGLGIHGPAPDDGPEQERGLLEDLFDLFFGG